MVEEMDHEIMLVVPDLLIEEAAEAVAAKVNEVVMAAQA
jgi:hypothetical protein